MKTRLAMFALAMIGALLIPVVSGAQSDPSIIQNSATLTATGAVAIRNLTTQSTCTTTIVGGTGTTVTFEGEGNGVVGGNANASGPTPDLGSYSGVNTTTFTGGAASTTTTSNGLFISPVAGLTAFRARISAYGSGNVILTVTCANGVYANPNGSGSSGGTYTAPPNQPVSQATGASPFTVTFPSPQPVTGSFYPAIQPISGAPTPIPTLPANADGGSPVHIANSAVPVNPTLAVGAGTLSQGQLTLTTTAATLISAARTGAVGTGRVTITIVNNSTTAIYLGAAGVTSSTGVILPGAIGASVTLPTTTAIYGCLAATGSATLSYYELF